jgi:hypothetical protein
MGLWRGLVAKGPKFLIAAAVVADGRLPGLCNLLHISLRHGNFRFRRNIIPTKEVVVGNYLPESLVNKCSQDAVPLPQAVEEMCEWLEKFKGTRIIATSSVSFWHLTYAVTVCRKKGMKLPWSIQPLDVYSWDAGRLRNWAYLSSTSIKDPDLVMEERYGMFEGGAIMWIPPEKQVRAAATTRGSTPQW